jgi:hypothetical protein
MMIKYSKLKKKKTTPKWSGFQYLVNVIDQING